jgi:hypothetical protein
MKQEQELLKYAINFTVITVEYNSAFRKGHEGVASSNVMSERRKDLENGRGTETPRHRDTGYVKAMEEE